MESEKMKAKLLAQRVAELERIISQKQLEIDYLTVCIEVASEEVGIDLKEKYAPPSSTGSGDKEGKDTPLGSYEPGPPLRTGKI